MAVLMKKNNQLVPVGYSIKYVEQPPNKFNQLITKTIATVTAEDMAGATNIPMNFFQSCHYLASIVIPNTVTRIEIQAFQGCDSLTSITIPNSVTLINNNAFHNCAALTSFAIPDSVTSLGSYVFQNCFALQSVTIGTGITKIPYAFFMGCVRLSTITVPANVTRIEGEAFSICSSLTGITIEATTPPTLDNVNAFNSTNNCPIYVPASSLSDYQSASNWSSLSSRLQAIPS